MSDSSGGAVVLVSGGLDSSVLMHYVCRSLGRAPVHALSFHYGQRHAKELDCAAWQAQAAGVAVHRFVDLSFVGDLVKNGTALVTGGQDIPNFRELEPSELDQPPTYVPNRNMMLLSVGAAYAEAHGIREVFYGAQALDEYGYWDCTPEFRDRINGVLALNRRDAVSIQAPFVTKKKWESVKLGLELGVDFAHTWSCYRGGAKACGRCPTCVERLQAFQRVGVEDPLEYECCPV